MPAPVESLFAQWLQADSLWLTRIDADTAARWGATAMVSERVTGIATAAEAQAEAGRQLAFHGRGPFAIDVHTVSGAEWIDRLCQIVTLTGDQLGYEGGVDVLVLEAQVDHATGLSTLAVLRPLGASS